MATTTDDLPPSQTESTPSAHHRGRTLSAHLCLKGKTLAPHFLLRSRANGSPFQRTTATVGIPLRTRVKPLKQFGERPHCRCHIRGLFSASSGGVWRKRCHRCVRRCKEKKTHHFVP